MRKFSVHGLTLLKTLEGSKKDGDGNHVIYLDQAGKKTLGFGHLILPIESFTTLTEKEATALLSKDVKWFETGVDRLLGDILVTMNQFDALVIFAFNIGLASFGKSTLLKRVKANKMRAAFNEFKRWKYITVNGKKVVSPGLINRRKRVAALFRTPDSFRIKPPPLPAAHTKAGKRRLFSCKR